MDAQEVKKNIFESSIVGLVRVMLAIPLYLILTPFILNKLGVEDFAIWSFSTIIISLISLGDFGFKNSLIYNLANNITSKNEQNIYYNNAALFFAIIAILIIVCTALISPYLSNQILEIPPEHTNKSIFVFNIIAISFASRFISTPFQAVVESHQKIYFSHYVMITWLITNFIFTIIALNISPSIYYLGAASLLPNIIVFSMYYYKVKKEYPYIKLDLSLLSIKHIKKMIEYGSGIYIATIAIAIREPVIKVLIAKNTDLVTVASFELSYRLAIQAISIVKTPLLSIFSASALLANDRDQLNKIISPFCNYNIALLVPSSVFFFTFSNELIALWLGSGQEKTAEILPLIFLSLSLYYLTEPLYKTIAASGKSYYCAAVQIINISLCFVFFKYLEQYGHYTPAFVLLISFGIFSMINLISFHILFNEIKTYSYLKSAALLLVGVGFVTLSLSYSIYLKSILFVFYVLIHFTLCKLLKLFDIVTIFRKVVSVITPKINDLKSRIFS